MILSRLGKRKTPTPLESDLPSITVAQEKQQYPIPRPKTEGNCDKYIYFPKVLCPSGLTSSMGRCEGVGQRADEIWCPQVQLEGGGQVGVSSAHPFPRSAGRVSLSRPPHTRWLSCPPSPSRCTCYSQRCRSSARRRIPWTAGGRRESRGEDRLLKFPATCTMFTRQRQGDWGHCQPPSMSL